MATLVEIQKWVEEGNKILDNQYHERWAKCVPIRLDDLYEGMELGCTLQICGALNSGCDLIDAKI